MADTPSDPAVPVPEGMPFLPQTVEQAHERDAMVLGAEEVVTAPTVDPPVPLQMSVGSPAADDALFAALETAHAFISKVTGWKGEPSERQDVLELTAAALQAIAAPVES